MAHAPTFPKTVRKKSRLHGWGVFAAESINKNKRIIDYAGELIDQKESYKRELKYIKRGCIWCFAVNNRWVRDANVDGNIARFINHSCKPNCYSYTVGKTIWIQAGRHIRAGEELTYDYYTDGDHIIQCTCRPGCKRRL